MQDYLAENPSLADDIEGLLKLIQGEFLARLERGEDPEPSLYEECFPDLAEAIRLQCEVDRWMAIPDRSVLALATTVDYRGHDRADRSGDDATDNGSLRLRLRRRHSPSTGRRPWRKPTSSWGARSARAGWARSTRRSRRACASGWR